MRFFLDNCLPLRWAPALQAFSDEDGHTVFHLRSKFRANVSDIEWIGALALEGGWTILSGDRRITKSRHEREAWLQSGLTAFFLDKGWMNLSLWDQSWRIVRWWPKIIEASQLVKPGAGFVIPVNYGSGKLQQIPLK